jgi:predicted nuclease with TOPRIM domain
VNNPIPDNDFERRLAQVERDMARLMSLSHLEQINNSLNRIQSDTGSALERLDALEQGVKSISERFDAFAQTQADHGERFDELKQELHTHSDVWLRSLQENFDQAKEALVEIRMTQGSHNERFDTQGQRLGKMDSKLDLIVQLLQQKPPEGQP